MKKLVLALMLSAAAAAQTTVAEKSGYRRTGRYSEVLELGRVFARQWPKVVRQEVFGTTPEGRPMLALVIQKRPGQPVVLIQGGIHAGEIDGKDAGFELLRDLLRQSGPTALDRVTVVFVPVFNIDGHERFGPNHRPNQNGPEEMGWRVTAQNLNLNRDYSKADAPEMRAMIRLLRKYDPILYVDLHVTDGAQFRHEVANLVEPIFVGDPDLQKHGKAFQAEVNRRVAEHLPLPFYPSFRDGNNPASGVSDGAYTPRFSTGYWPLCNRLAMLVETHSWKDYRTRVKTTRDVVRAVLDIAARDGGEWLRTARRADQKNLAGQNLALDFKTTDRHHMIEFQGYAYRLEPSDISGTQALRYDTGTPQVWQVPYYDEVVPKLEVKLPERAYLVPPAQALVVGPLLDLHGIRYRRLEQPRSEATRAFRAETVTYSPRSFEGRTTLKLTGQWRPERQVLSQGTLVVPIHQPRARLLAALLEPQAPDSLAAWGFFNAHFEQREYMEDYVAEEVARQASPEVLAEFRQKLAADPQFAASPGARLDFFYRRHPSYDRRKDLYPVFKL